MVDQLPLPLPQRAIRFLSLEEAAIDGRSRANKGMKTNNAETENEA